MASSIAFSLALGDALQLCRSEVDQAHYQSAKIMFSDDLSPSRSFSDLHWLGQESVEGTTRWATFPNSSRSLKHCRVGEMGAETHKLPSCRKVIVVTNQYLQMLWPTLIGRFLSCFPTVHAVSITGVLGHLENGFYKGG